jgi:hypothetical protein
VQQILAGKRSTFIKFFLASWTEVQILHTEEDGYRGLRAESLTISWETTPTCLLKLCKLMFWVFWLSISIAPAGIKAKPTDIRNVFDNIKYSTLC